MSQPIIYLAFANDKDNPLKSLEEEEKGIREELRSREEDNHFEVEHDSFATREVIARRLADFKNDLYIFHYSGHADEAGLETAGEKTLSEGIAGLLGDCPRLRLVVLNGCSTRKQVDLLLEKGVPAVVATHAPIKDPKAKEFGITFYHELADFKPFKEAFNTAIDTVKTMEGSEEVEAHRSIRLRPQDQIDDSKLWGLFHGEEERAVDKKLPEKIKPPEDDFEPNEELVRILIDAVEAYVPIIKKLQDEEKNSPVPIDHSGRKRVEMIKSLPYPVGELLRSLLAESTDMDENIYAKPSRDRLLLLINLHDNLMETIAYVVMATLWDAVNNEELKEIPAEIKKQLTQFLVVPSAKRSADTYFPVIRQALALLKDKASCLMEELIDQSELFQEDQPFYRASSGISDIKAKGDFREMDHSEISFLCLETEKQLTRMFEQVGFLARYKLISVKGIDVFKHRGIPQAAYIHNVLRLVVNSSDKDKQLIFYQGHFDTKSVFLVQKEQMEQEAASTHTIGKALNLTPFIIDEHAFDTDRATEAKLYFLDHLDQEKGDHQYRELIYPDKELLSPAERIKIADKDKNKRTSEFRYLSSQFDSFSSSFIS